MRVLVLNAGSSSLKASLIDGADERRTTKSWGSDATLAEAREETIAAAVRDVAGETAAEVVDAVGHRIVHGGERFTGPVAIDDVVMSELSAVSELAPLHNPVAVSAAEAARRLLPNIPHVATFDTAFHATLPEVWRRYPVANHWRDQWGVRRYGFHGLSVAWSTRRAAELLERPAAELRLVVAHLGSGCSVTAVDGGRSAYTSMGMTPLEGLMMGTRAGSIDPGMLLQLLEDGRATAEQLAEDLEHRSGLLGVSGASGDMRELSDAGARGDRGAAVAIEMFIARAASGIAAAATTLPDLDALVFTGGIGENAADVRSEIVARLRVLGFRELWTRAVESDAGALESDAVLTPAGARPAVLRIEAREDRVIATEVESVVSGTAR